MEPNWQHLFEIYTRLSYVRVASYTSHTLPFLNTKQVAVKVISKDQQPLVPNTIEHSFKTSFCSTYIKILYYYNNHLFLDSA